MNRLAKRKFYMSIDTTFIGNDKKFYKTIKPYFSNVNPITDRLIFIQNDEIVSEDKMIAECLNSHFVNITNSLGLDPTFKCDTVYLDMEFQIDSAVLKYKEHSITSNIRNKAACASTFQFEHVNM